MVVLIAAALVACGQPASEPGDDALGDGQLVSDESVYPGEAGPLVGAVVHTDEQAAQLWDEAELSDEPPSLDEHALVAIAGGEADDCPWELTDITVEHRSVELTLDEADEQAFCEGRWDPRTLAVTVPADTLAEDAEVVVVQPWGEAETAADWTDRPDAQLWESQAVAAGHLPQVGGCGDAFVYGTSDTDAILVAVRWDEAASRAAAEGTFSAEAAVPSPEVSIELEVGSDLSKGHCTDMLLPGRPLIAGEWEAVSGEIAITVEPDRDAHEGDPRGSASVTLRGVELEPLEGSAADPWRIEELELDDALVGWAPG